MSTNHIPVINISNLHLGETLRALDSACREWGAFQIVNHGIDKKIAEDVFTAMHQFFAQPTERKRSISRSYENPWGFYDQELTKNTRDWKEIFDYGPANGSSQKPQWPPGLAQFKPAVLAFYRAGENLAFRLLQAIASNLGVSVQQLTPYFRPHHTSFVRLNYYPEHPKIPKADRFDISQCNYLGVNQHTDAGVLTILLQDNQAGLEVFRNNQWHLVEPRSEALVINLGDIVQVWSNDRYCAPVHRVITHEGVKRFTAPFFFNPAYNTEYSPLPTMIDDRHPPRYRQINWGEFRQKRALGDYADVGEEIQISHYRQP